jgi:hypothetical protein
VQAAGVHVVGDLADLEPRLEAGGVQPDALTDAAVLDAAVDGLVFLAENRTKEIHRLRQVNTELRREVKSQRRRLTTQRRTLTRLQPGTTPPPAQKSAWASVLRRAYRRSAHLVGRRR